MSKTDGPAVGKSHEDLFATVIQGGYCVGCGACASVKNTPFEMHFGSLGTYLPTLKPNSTTSADQQQSLAAVCPFSAAALDETTIGRELFSSAADWHHEIGFHRETYVGHVSEGDFRKCGSSGGMGTWLASELLATGFVDGIVHVTSCQNNLSDRNLLFKYKVSYSVDEVQAGAGSRYYPISLADVMAWIQSRPNERFAFVGVPCFIKAIRLLARQNADLSRSVAYCIGLVCGHLKSAAYADFIGWQLGILPKNLASIEFREKTRGRKANDYVARATQRTGQLSVARPMTELLGGNWSHGFFKLKSCEYCDDMIAETADVVVGDAWLPEFIGDSRGTNVLVVRHPNISMLITNAIAAGRLALQQVRPDVIAESQRSGLRYRREGLAVRLADASDRGEWTPPKRVSAGRNGIPLERVVSYRLREKMAATTHLAFREALNNGDLALFLKQIKPLLRTHAKAKRISVLRRNLYRAIDFFRNSLQPSSQRPPGSIPPP